MIFVLIPTIIALAELVALVLLHREWRTAEEVGLALVAYLTAKGQLPPVDEIDPYLRAVIKGGWTDRRKE